MLIWPHHHHRAVTAHTLASVLTLNPASQAHLLMRRPFNPTPSPITVRIHVCAMVVEQGGQVGDVDVRALGDEDEGDAEARGGGRWLCFDFFCSWRWSWSWSGMGHRAFISEEKRV